MKIICDHCATEYDIMDGKCPKCGGVNSLENNDAKVEVNMEAKIARATSEANRMIMETYNPPKKDKDKDVGVSVLRAVALILILIVLGMAIALAIVAM